jgi:S1-C subfamily serine protease
MIDQPPPSPPNAWRSRFRRLRAAVRRAVPFASGVLAALVALLLYNSLFPAQRPLTTTEVKQTVAQVMASATPPPAYSDLVYRVIRPSLLLIETSGRDAEGKIEHGLGSGVVINDNGDILTALHVVTNTDVITLTYANGYETGGIIASQQPENDIAVVQASQPPTQTFPAVLGNPGAMRVGDEAYAVGNPFGLYSSMSAGVISAFDRSFHPPSSTVTLRGLIQIDAAVNPGNSGGPLLNRAGEVIGIVEGIVNPTDGDFFVGIGFAVPINNALGGAGGGSPPY